MHPTDPIEKHFRLQPTQKMALKKLRIETIRDLLYHFPARYQDVGAHTAITDVRVGEKVVVYGKLGKLKLGKAWRKKIPMADGVIEDTSGTIKAVWFHQPYIAKMFSDGTLVKAEGKVAERKGEKYLSNPDMERVSTLPNGAGLLSTESAKESGHHLPVYPESRGVTSRWFYYTIQKILADSVLETLEDPIPTQILKRYHLPTLHTALVWIHSPKKNSDSAAARKRFAFEEVFLIQLKHQQARHAYAQEPSWEIEPTPEDTAGFTKRFPFTPTTAQSYAVTDILKDFKTPHAMSRLLEGDVGSGKTFVAAVTAHAVVTTPPKRTDGTKQDFGNLQVAYMAPTEILAKQHFESFIEFFTGLPIQIGLITSSGCRKFPSKVSPDSWTDISRTQLLKWVENGEIPILIGTHALIQKTVRFKHLAYVIIDEQHRFGTRQRAELAKKDTDVQLPHLLSMTATPIPRTLALTIYGDLDLTVLDEMPAGRKPIKTEIVTDAKREAMYAHVRKELSAGRQAYVITPRIDEPDEKKIGALRAKSVKKEARRLQEDVFPNHTIGILHGKMTAKEKDAVMQKFTAGEIAVLVATSVVEVGVNVPDATVIVIEGAERFGLSQLHQLRGRVLRSTHQAHAYIVPDTKSGPSLKRLRALAKAENGFALAELDLQFRGAGDLYGTHQWGISDLGMEAIRNVKMVEAARKEAEVLVEKDPTLTKHPLLKEASEGRAALHLE